MALVIGRPPKEHDLIEAPIGRIGMKRTTLERGGKLRDKKEAVTEYRVIQKFSNYTLLEVSPKTGRTHQIRVHLQHIGHPIAGDPIYAPKATKDSHNPPRLFLHAQKISFTTQDGKAMTLEADLPPELQKFLEELAPPKAHPLF